MSPRRTRRARLAAVAAAVACAVSLTPFWAAADDTQRLSVDWDKLSVVLRDPSSIFPSEPSYAGMKDGGTIALPSAWFGTLPRLALVARDWGVSQVLWGHFTVTDQFRLSRSSRMVVTRVGLGDGRLTPFVHIGVGQWRVDTSVLPTTPTDVELAGQLGAGFELQLARQAVLAVEADYTVLCREDRVPAMLSSGQLWGTLLAARARF